MYRTVQVSVELGEQGGMRGVTVNDLRGRQIFVLRADPLGMIWRSEETHAEILEAIFRAALSE